VYLQTFLNNLPMPSGLPNLAAYITPPSPNVQADVPVAYIWPSTGEESRNSARVGTVPRNTGPGTPSGWKNIQHHIDIWLVFFWQDDDSESDTLFTGIVDAVMFALRTSPEIALAVDPYTEQQSWLLDIGENISYRIDLRAVSDQAYNRYDAQLTVPLIEALQA
jgi:hypothetical protein